jgi:phosphatidylserine decarboxylase
MFARGSASIIALVGSLAVLSFVASIFSSKYLLVPGVLLILLTAFVGWFFRDPERKAGDGIVAAADGVVHAVSDLGDRVCVATFMNVHDVHVNRAPVSGTIVRVQRLKGPFLPAYDSRANKNNRRSYVIRSDIGDVEVVQICGIFARRIVPWVERGAKVKKGQRIGMIRFGSRVDVVLPKHTGRGDMITIRVKPRERVYAAITTLATISPKKKNALPEEGGR